MADRQISELDPVKESPIGGLPEILELYDDSLIPVEQQGKAMRMTGRQFRQFGEKTAEMYVNTAVKAAEDATAAKTAAETARDAAKASQTAAKASETAAGKSKDAAADSATKAKASETAAANSQTAAASSASSAAESKSAAAGSAVAAKNSETNAASSAAAAKASQDAAKVSETSASSSKTAAAGSASAAANSAAAAAASAKSVENMAQTSRSYAVGGTGTRGGEDADNSKYYYEQAKRISQGLAGSLLPMGTVTFAQLQKQTKQAGYMYNISDAFTTDGTFREGTGHAYPAGTNVYYTADGYWDCLAGSAVVSVAGKTGAVTVTKADVGLGNVPNVATNDQTPTFTQAAARANLTSGEKLSVMLGKLSKWFADLKIVAFSGAYSDLTGKPTIPGASSTVPKAPGAASAGSESAWARGDHMHPAQTSVTGSSGSCTGNAATATKVGHDLTFTGAVTGAWNGSEAKSVAIPAASTTAPKAPGTAAIGAGTTWARADHVHPVQTSVTGSSGSCTGNAATATKVGHDLTFTGAVTGTWNGSAAKSVAIPTTAQQFLNAHPVGSYYWSSNATSPASLFGGTWTQIKDRFVLAAGDTYKVDATGGSVTHQHEAGTLRADIMVAGGYLYYKHIAPGFDCTYWHSGMASGTAGTYNVDSSTVIEGSTDTASNMPPYLVAYCWKRTA